jgi:hypothetical protein
LRFFFRYVTLQTRNLEQSNTHEAEKQKPFLKNSRLKMVRSAPPRANPQECRRPVDHGEPALHVA